MATVRIEAYAVDLEIAIATMNDALELAMRFTITHTLTTTMRMLYMALSKGAHTSWAALDAPKLEDALKVSS